MRRRDARPRADHGQPLNALLATAIILAVVFGGGAVAGERPAKTPAANKNGVVRVMADQAHQLTVVKAQDFPFQARKSAIGQIAFNEDLSTPVLPQFSGRVVRSFASVGAQVKPGDPLLEIDSNEVMQSQNDFIAAVTALNKARAQLNLSQTIEARQRTLYDGKATPLRELQLAEAQLAVAQNDLRSSETALGAARNRLRIIGRSDEEIAALQDKGAISRTVIVTSPVAGTIISRKVAPGQFVRTDAPDPLFVIADLSSMWLKAFVSEGDAPVIRIDQDVEVKVLALPEGIFKARVVAIGAASDQNTRRVVVRSEIANPDGVLKADMFATFKIATGNVELSPAVPVEAVIRHGEEAAVWVELEPLVFKRRLVRLGLELNDRIQIREGLKAGERVLGRGAIFVDNEWRQ